MIVTGDRGESLRRPACVKCLHSKEETLILIFMRALGQDNSHLQWHNCPEVMYSWIRIHC